jgi:arogenate/prephenate dehydratase
MCIAVMMSALRCCVVVQALAQTDTYLRKLGVIKEAVDDTAGAAQMVARQQLKVRHPSLHRI